MKSHVVYPLLAIFFLISYFIWDRVLPDWIQEGGFLIIGLMMLAMILLTIMIERIFTLRRAQGKGDIASFARKLRQALEANDMAQAVEVCRMQGGSLANVVGAGLERYMISANSGMTPAARLAAGKKAIQDANALETPLLERNLNFIATIASVATLFGLLGTTMGMIRSFQAMGQAGAPDAIKLAVGISEALLNTAGGLSLAIISIIAYNIFTARVDGFNYLIDETSHEIVQQLEERTGVLYGQA
jgi:biopolymer transport protein ExbB